MGRPAVACHHAAAVYVCSGVGVACLCPPTPRCARPASATHGSRHGRGASPRGRERRQRHAGRGGRCRARPWGGCGWQRRCQRPGVGPGVGPVALEPAAVERLLAHALLYTRPPCLPPCPQHRPIAPRLGRQSWRAGPGGPGRPSARAHPALACRCRVPTTGEASPGQSPGCPWARAGVSRGAARSMPRTLGPSVGPAAVSCQALGPWCSACKGLIACMVMDPGASDSAKHHQSLA
jgi:hypothetical protein